MAWESLAACVGIQLNFESVDILRWLHGDDICLGSFSARDCRSIDVAIDRQQHVHHRVGIDLPMPKQVRN
jgi:hypothetical protein